MRKQLVTVVMSIAASWGALSCGAAPQAPASSPEPAQAPGEGGLAEDRETPRMDTVEQAQAELARANRELDQLYGEGAGETVALGVSPGPAEPTAESAPARRASDRCETACRAFASLERAAEALCEMLAGADDPEQRCDRARATVEKNRQRVEPCGCTPD